MTENEQIQEEHKEVQQSGSGYIPLPRLTGKFNFSTINSVDFMVQFVPYRTDATIIVARDLSFDEASELAKGLNEELACTREDIENRANQQYHKRRKNQRI